MSSLGVFIRFIKAGGAFLLTISWIKVEHCCSYKSSNLNCKRGILEWTLATKTVECFDM